MIRTTSDFLHILRAARRVSTPLICARTADPASALGLIQESLNGNAESVPVTVWDILSGLRSANAAAKENLCRVLNERDPSTVGPADALVLAAGMADDSVLVFSNAHRFWHDPAVAQGIWNLRDHFKSSGSMLVLLAAPGAALPTELSQDVLVLDEPLPSAEDLARIVKETFAAAEIDEPAPDVGRRAVDALLGLSAFPAEQALAMSLAKSGLDTEQLWERKRQVIEQTPGLSVWCGGESFADIGGCENIRRFLGAVIAGEEAPRVVVFVDEIEKAFAGTGTDLSGVKTEMTGTMLSWMQDREADGVVLIGPAGTAKSAVAKAAGTAAGIPTIAFDFGAMQNSLVGASGERLRSALQVVDAVSNELIDKYIRGAVSLAERAQFERHFLASKRRRDRYEAMRAIAASLFRDQSNPHRSLLRSFQEFFFMQSRAARALMACAAAVTMVAAGLLAAGYLQLRKQNADALALLATSRPAPAPPEFVLQAGLLRSAGATRNQVRLAPNAELIVLRLETTGSHDYASFAVALGTAEGEEILRQDRLSPANGAIGFRIPAALLTAGQDYTVSIAGRQNDGNRLDLQSYVFHVAR